jgi:hypothetical protein
VRLRAPLSGANTSAVREVAMPRLLYALALGALVIAAPAAARKDMKATAPEKMMPPGAGDAIRACDKLAMEQHVPMEQHARFVKECVAKKMKK